MYSMVLAMALSGGAATPADHGCIGSGCHGVVVSHGCWGSSCHGGGHRLLGGLFKGHGCHGCSSACHGYSCSSSCHGCSGWASCHSCNGCNGCHGGHRLLGRLFKGHGCHGCHSSHGCHGCYVSHGCHMSHDCAGCHGGAVKTMPAAPAKEAAPAPKKEGGKEEANANRSATLIVSLPAEAKLAIDGNATTSTTATRVFTTPDLDAGVDFAYTLTAELKRDGQTLTASKQVTVRAGQETRVTLEFPAASVASR